MKSEAFSPAHMTGFFEICLSPRNPLLSGSRGAGFSIQRGVTTRIQIDASHKPESQIRLNGRVLKDARVSKHVLKTFLDRVAGNYSIQVEHEIDVPVGSGFGSSGAAALSLALALNKAFRMELSPVEVAQMAHVAEIECKTGLGTVIAEACGGVEMRIKPGAPGVGEIRRIPVEDDYSAVALHYGPISTTEALTNPDYFCRINGIGGKFVDMLASNPTVEKFLQLSHRFTESCGFATSRMKRAMREAERRGFVCSMAMFGETVFSLVRASEVEELSQLFSGYAPSNDIFVGRIDSKGARLL